MKKLLFPFVLLLMIFVTSCDTANYRKELENNFGTWNSNLRRTTDLHSRFSEVQDRTKYKELKTFVKSVDDDLTRSIDILKVELKRQSNEDIKKLKESTVEYLEAEKNIVNVYDVLVEDAENMSDKEFDDCSTKLDTLFNNLNDKADDLIKVQDEFAAKHDINIQRNSL